MFCDKNVTAADLRQIAEGITLDDGEIRADAIEYASPTDKNKSVSKSTPDVIASSAASSKVLVIT